MYLSLRMFRYLYWITKKIIKIIFSKDDLDLNSVILGHNNQKKYILHLQVIESI